MITTFGRIQDLIAPAQTLYVQAHIYIKDILRTFHCLCTYFYSTIIPTKMLVTSGQVSVAISSFVGMFCCDVPHSTLHDHIPIL